MANKLHYNVEEMRAQANKITQIKTDLKKSKDSLTTNLDLLRTEWVSDSATKFFSEYDSSWVQYIDKYCAMLEEVARELNWSANQYEQLTTDFGNVKLDV